jgi:hypothetical protein
MSTVECTFLVIWLNYLVQVCTSFFKSMFAYLIMIADTDWKYSNQQIVFATWLMLTAPSTYQWRVLSSDQLSWLLNYVNISLITILSFYFPGNLQGPEFRSIKSNCKHIPNFHAHTDFSWDWSLLHFILQLFWTCLNLEWLGVSWMDTEFSTAFSMMYAWLLGIVVWWEYKFRLLLELQLIA